VFVEVRYRRRETMMSAVESVGPRKRLRLLHTGEYFLQHARIADSVPCRFDIVTVTGTRAAPKISWLRDAFDADDC